MSERFSPPIDLDDVWNATLRPAGSTIARPEETQHPSHQTSPSSFQAKVTSEPPSQSPGFSSRLHNGNSLAEAKSHHRQTSIVHGIQHSRNGSFASASANPLSPQIIAAAGGERSDASNMGDTSLASALSGMSGGSSFSSNATLVPERPPPPSSEASHRRVERMHSGNNSRDFRHHRSQSRKDKEEPKTVGEYALHVLFNTVSVFTSQGSSFVNTLSSLHTPRRKSTNVLPLPLTPNLKSNEYAAPG